MNEAELERLAQMISERYGSTAFAQKQEMRSTALRVAVGEIIQAMEAGDRGSAHDAVDRLWVVWEGNSQTTAGPNCGVRPAGRPGVGMGQVSYISNMYGGK